MADPGPRRILRVVEAFDAQPPGSPDSRLCLAAAKLLDATGVGVSLGGDGDLRGTGLQTVCATDGGRAGEARQFDLGEGPSYTAHRTGAPVQVPDLERDHTWPAFSRAAVGLGLGAVFAFPLRSGSISLGALTVYRQVPGELSSEQYADALIVARFALNVLALLQAGRSDDELDQVFTDTPSSSMEVHQASGIVAVQLGISVAAALAVMRAHAFAEASSLPEVATLLISRRLKLGPLHDD